MLIAAVAANAIALSTNWLQPVLLVEILTLKGMSGASAGLVLSVEMLALSVSSALCAKLPRGTPFLPIALAGALTAGLGDLLSILAPDYRLLLASRILCGVGEGATMMVYSASLARFADPERAYGVVNVVSVLCGAILVYAAPAIGHFTGGRVTFPTLLAWIVLMIPALLLMPRSERLADSNSGATPAGGPVLSRSIVVIAVACFLFSVTGAAMWSFYFVIGGRTGLEADAINRAIAVATMLSLIGSLAASVMGSRFGRRVPISLGLVLVAGAIFWITHTQSATVYRLAMAVDLIGIYFLLPLFFGFAAAEDRGGRGAAMIGSAFFAGLAFGPWFGGVIFERFGYESMGWIAVVVNCVTAVLAICVDRFAPAPVRC